MSGWTYTGSDPGLALFTACYKAGAPMPLSGNAKVLEVGCCEANWLTPAAAAWPDASFTGIDIRKSKDANSADGRVSRLRASVLNPDLFPADHFDAVVSLSAIEHIGLGHYGDPLDPDGDSKAVANIWRWLKPGGWFYFDVPYDPTGYRVQGTKCRVYDDAEAMHRLELVMGVVSAGPVVDGVGYIRARWMGEFVGYVHADAAGTLIPKPKESAKPFHYRAMVWRKA